MVHEPHEPHERPTPTGPTASTGLSALPRAARRWPLLLAVLVGHLLLIGGLGRASLSTTPPPHQPTSRLRMVTLQLPPLSTPTARRSPSIPTGERTTRWRSASSRTSQGPASISSPRPRPSPDDRLGTAPGPSDDVATLMPPKTDAQPDPTHTQPQASTPLTAAAPSASGPSGQTLMSGDATRRAIQQSARAPLLSERADQASQAPDRTEASARLGQEMQRGAKSDCLKGDFAGGGGGLLSLPFWLIAEARGKCR
ncbi:hypothetical protein [Roseateles amylovorans]|uniref:ESPR domain-containing protein n=1 Tax=Roseateles amylovorans TaxID=2978473 RepID=A0ABY6B470_9BURK|nr:hypothetical protein [Roseateles amylovorans]UXH79637.1 hypothetical protein N4261_06905 [Roseateles amylovorans]